MVGPPHLPAYEAESQMAQLAAAYGFGIVPGHAFKDTNKRSSFLALGLFLAHNNRELATDPTEAIALILRLAEVNSRRPNGEAG